MVNVGAAGEEIAAVAATSQQACLDALGAIVDTAEALPFVVRQNDAKKAGSPQVWQNGPSYVEQQPRDRGQVDAAFDECAAVIKRSYCAPVQIHNPGETSGNAVSCIDDGVTAWSSTQGLFSVRDGLAGRGRTHRYLLLH